MWGKSTCMAYTLSNKCAKNCCKRTILVQVIIEDVVTCFFGTQCSFSIPNVMAIFRQRPLTRASNAGGWGGVSKNRDSRPTSGFIACCQRCDRRVLHTQMRRTVHGKLVTPTAGKRRRLFVLGRRTTKCYDKQPQHYAEDNRTAFNCTQWQGWSRSN